MTTPGRPSRSSSIPIPRSSSSLSPSRNIESVISIPFASPTRPRLASSQRSNTSEEHRSLSASYGTRGSTSRAIAAPPTRSSASLAMLAGGARRVSRTPATFEPRVVRVTGDQPRTGEACVPPSSSQSRTRRVSTGARATSAQRPAPTHFVPISEPPVSFPRPTYLDHSALRHMLHTEPTSSLPLSRKAEPPHERHFMSPMSPLSDSDDDSNVSPPRELAPPPRSHDEILRLPTRWDEQYCHSMLSISPDRRELSYHGVSCNGEKDAAAARTNHSIPPACGIYYYEVEIINKGQKGHISIGFAACDVKLSRLPGWETNSWGYHGDDGCSFAGDKSGPSSHYGPTYGTGDIVGCGIDFTTHRAFFTKNGTLIGPVFDGIGRNVALYPSIGLRHSNEHVRVNLGHEPFKFDIDYHVQQQQTNVWAKILTTPLDPSLLDVCSPQRDGAAVSVKKASLTDEQTRDVMNKLVLSYLEHHGYARTMRAFQKQLCNNAMASAGASSSLTSGDRDVNMADGPSKDSDVDESDMEHRTNIVKSVISGDIDTAISDAKTHYPAVLEADEGLMFFKLRCRKFVELILEAAELKKRMRNRSVNRTRGEDDAIAEMDDVDEDGTGMDVDDEGVSSSSPPPPPTMIMNGFRGRSTPVPIPGPSRRRSPLSPRDAGGSFGADMVDGTTARYEAALNQAISYGQTLLKNYKDDVRPEVKHIFKLTFAIVAWEDPMTAGGIVSEVVGHEARVALAHELNKAILKSQGRPGDPMLETLYRHTTVCVAELGVRGVGGAALADMQKEFFEG